MRNTERTGSVCQYQRYWHAIEGCRDILGQRNEQCTHQSCLYGSWGGRRRKRKKLLGMVYIVGHRSMRALVDFKTMRHVTRVGGLQLQYHRVCMKRALVDLKLVDM